MKIVYDKEVDAMFIELRKGKFAKNKKLNDCAILDLDKDGNILGIELLDVSKRISIESPSGLHVERLTFSALRRHWNLSH